MSLVARNNAKSVPNPPSKPAFKWRKILRRGILVFSGIFILIALLWTQRTTLAEWVIQNGLSKQGIDADLTVSELSGSHAKIEQIHLLMDGRPFFSASELEAFYEWRMALKGQISRVDIFRPEISSEIDKNGKLIWPKLPTRKRSADTNTGLPANGIFITDGQLNLKTPYGDLFGTASGTIQTLQKFVLSGTLGTDQISFTDSTGQATSSFHVKRDQGTVQLTATADIPNWNVKNLYGQNLHIEVDNKVGWNNTHLNLEGPIQVNFGTVSSEDFELQTGVISSKGLLNIPLPNAPEHVEKELSTDWTVNIGNANLTQKDLREKLAEALTLNQSLTNISATAPFAPKLKPQAAQLLQNVSVQGQGHFELGNKGMTASLAKPFQITGEKSTLTLSSVGDKAFYTFDPPGKQVGINFNADIDGAYKVNVSNAYLIARSVTGLDLESVTNFDADFKTLNTWRALTPEGRLARLSPLTAKVGYENLKNIRNISMSGALNYDGDIPGGYVTGLRTQGKMRLRLTEDALTAWFRPLKGKRIKIEEMNTVSDWVARNITLTLTSSTPIYQRNVSKGMINAAISTGSGTLVHKTRDIDLDFDFKTAEISGTTFRSNGRTTQQVWNISAVDAHMVSDTIPTLGTDIKAPELSMTATLWPGNPLHFTAQSPAIDLITPQMNAQNLKLSASGTSESLRVDYENGTIAFTAMPLPPLPIKGFAAYNDGAWSGDAVTYLARAEETPIDVTYRLENGQGHADITVTDLPFTPRGLQPKHLLPAFGGKVAQVKGFVDAEITVGFGGNLPLTTSAKTKLKNMSMGTLPGPITGLNADLSFSNLYPPQTSGPQTITLETFDPGLPLENGEVSFALIPDGIDIYYARWPMGNGFISLDPTDWKYSRPENRMTLKVDNVSISEFLKGTGGENLKVTGDVSGELPVVISGVNVLVENGVLAVKEGGVIQYSTAQTNVAADNNEVAGYAFDALKNFEYKSLEAKLNGPLDGDIDLRMVFAGRNRDVLGGAEFLFNVGVQGQLFNIARSFQTGKGITATVKEEIASRDK